MMPGEYYSSHNRSSRSQWSEITLGHFAMIEFHNAPFLQGFATSAGLIIAIGTQNAFVLKQAILRNHIFLIALYALLLIQF